MNDHRPTGTSIGTAATLASPPAERRARAETDPPYLHADYRSTLLRSPLRPLARISYGPTELTGPSPTAILTGSRARAHAADLTRQHAGEPLGQRSIIHGRVSDASGRPLSGVLVEIWQANSAGRYAHECDQHPAPLDPNFTGAGHCVTDRSGDYRFVTIRPGPYPWRNHANAWRPAHIHFSVLGRAFSQRLITQMYFPDDPLLPHDPIFHSIADDRARERLVCRLDLSQTEPEWAIAWRFDLVLGGREATPAERLGEP